MNDFERQLRRQPFRQPPADLRAALFGEEPVASLVTPPAWTWQDWLWPSPQAWGAMAALWAIFAVAQFASPSTSASSAAPVLAASDSGATRPVTLFAYHNTPELRHVLDLPN